MLDQNTFIFVAIASAFTCVGILAWLVDAGISDKAKVFVKYGLFSLFAVVIGLFFMIKDDSEFEYSMWQDAKLGGGGDGGGGPKKGLEGGSGGGGKATAQSGGGGGGGGELALGDEESMEDTAVAEGEELDPTKVTDGEGAKQDCPVCPEMVQIHKGKALIGSAGATGGQMAPASEVTIQRDFGIGKYEVTAAQFAEFMGETDYKASRACKAGKTPVSFDKPGFKQNPASPAVCVSWKDAVAYVDWLTTKTSIPYRLPTEIEWEYAARAGVTEAYATPGPITAESANFTDKASPIKVSGTAAVGSYPANGNDLHDMQGNVWEMTADCWSQGYQGVASPGASVAVDCSRRIAKGGAWYSGPAHLKFSTRVGVRQDFANNGLGFRVVRENDAPMARKRSRLSNGYAGGAPTNFKELTR